MADKWKIASSPNYNTNKDKLYPYSELPTLPGYKLIKIPVCVRNFIQHIDYFGQGLVKTQHGFEGFSDCYNVYYEYNLVWKGPDEGRKIPNRIPLKNDVKTCNTSDYIKDNSVLTVTVSDNVLIYKFPNIIQDIIRIVNGDYGKVIIYGRNNNDNFIEDVTEEFKKNKQLFYCPIYMLPEKFQLSYYKTCYRVFLNLNELKQLLNDYIVKGDYDAAYIITTCLSDVHACNAIGDVVNKLLENTTENVLAYAYKLWNYNDKDILDRHFPKVFTMIFCGNAITIVNKECNQSLRFYDGQPCGGSKHEDTGVNTIWKIIPLLDEDDVRFQLFNIDLNLSLSLVVGCDEDENGYEIDVLAEGFRLVPSMKNGEVTFKIVDSKHGKYLILNPVVDKASHSSLLLNDDMKNAYSTWTLTNGNTVKSTDNKNDVYSLSHSCSSSIEFVV